MKIIYKTYTSIIALLFILGSVSAQINQAKLLGIKGHNTHFMNDGNSIVYNSQSKEVRIFELANATDQLVSKNSSLFELQGENIILKEKKEDLMINLKTGIRQNKSDKKMGISAWHSSDLHSIVINQNGVKKIIQPKGVQDYLNVSLSPDQSKIIFRVSGQSSFISDLDGNIIKELKDAEFPSWIDNDKVLYAIIEDDGYNFTSSKLYVESLISGSKKAISLETDLIPLYPSMNSEGNKLVFSTPEQDIYLLNL